MTIPASTSQFLSTLGVNVHVEYTDGKYANATNVINDLAYLGIKQVRDAVLNPNNQGQWNYDALAAAGIKFDMFFQGNNLQSTIALIDAFVAQHPGSVSLIEGPNEVNNFPISYNGQSGNAAAVAYQNALYAAVRADAHLSGVPVADLTSWPFLKGGSDYANYHFYPFNGQQVQSAYGTVLTDLSAQEPGKTIVMTEGGYNTMLSDTYFGGVDELTQAKLTLNMYCDNALAGVATTYIYQLLDAYADPSNSNSDDHFGLFNLDNSPKLVATAIHNLTSILSSGADPGVAVSNLALQLQGLPSLGGELVLTKSAGVHDVLLWSEPTIWNATTKTEVAVAATPAALHFSTASNVSVFDPLVGTSAIATYAGVQDVTVNLVDHPLVVEVTTLAAPVVTAPAPAAPAASTPAPVSSGASTPAVSPSPAATPATPTTPSTSTSPAPVAPTVPAATPVTTAPSTVTTSDASHVTDTSGSTGTITATSPVVTTTVVTTTVSPSTTSTVSSGGGSSTNVSALLAPASLANTVANLTRMAGSSNGTAATSDMSAASAIATKLAAGQITASAAQDAIFHLVDATTSVAVTSYAFFTGKTPTSDGLNYLVNSSSNPADLNDAYYAKFSTENRYINFAVALAQGGAGTAAYHSAYDGLSLRAATAQAYQAIFASPADAAKLDSLLNASVPNGMGGVETRAQYFAAYGGDGLNGAGTKAAMIGWLLAESVKAEAGPYQQADFNFLESLAHGTPAYNVDLLSTYAHAPTLIGAPVLDASLGS